MSRSFVAVAVALPLLAVGFGIVRAELTFARTRDFSFEINGFDPRDLFRGQYLQFRLTLEPASDHCTTAADSCCLCLTDQGSGSVPAIDRTTCGEVAGCDAWLDQDVARRAFRYYVSDVSAEELERRLQTAMQRRAARATMAVDASGQAHVRQLFVDGKPIKGRADDSAESK